MKAGGPGPSASFRVPGWARGPHVQTLFARALRHRARPLPQRERFETPDGDFLDVDWGPEPVSIEAGGPGEAPVVLVLHGLEGSSRRSYVRSVCDRLALRGVRPVAMNFRGCSGEPNRALRFYHSGETKDPTWLLEQIRARYPSAPLGAIGFSLGGNVVLKLMGEREDGGRALLAAAAVMSVPFDLAASCDLLEQSFMGGVYSDYFLRSLRRKVEWKRSTLSQVLDMDAVDSARKIRAFDDHVTAPLNGFRDAAEYYAECSSRRFLAGVGVPTLMVHSVDDPFLPATAIPRAEAAANDRLTLVLVPRGGHVGFVEGTPWSPRFWADETCADFVAGLLHEVAQRPTGRP
ncbi:MAG: hydrolase [Gemmatimonadota bacterium]|nr:hydrolase [Gemmatimonadota bacterium]